MSTEIAVSMRHVDVLFGPASQQAKALSRLDQQGTREDILADTGVVLGVADASLDVPVGSISVLMGLSGSGKSSLLRCVNGLNTVTRGVLEVRTHGGVVNVADCKGRALRLLRRNSLAMVFQQFALLPWATVRENIGFGLSVRGEKPAVIAQRVDEQLELVGLQAWADKRIQALSGGMQQRVGLARAFATDADILLMDEPFSALDPLIREHLQDELLELQSRLHKTILFVSHDLDEALKLGNQISIMDGGRIVQTGTADDIVFSPANDYVRRFVANINPLTVLTARVVMQAVSSAGDTWVHPDAPLSVQLQAGKPAAVTNPGSDGPRPVVNLLTSEKSSALDDISTGTIVCVSADAPVRQLLQVASITNSPVLVVDETGVLCGFIDHRHLFSALSQSS